MKSLDLLRMMESQPRSSRWARRRRSLKTAFCGRVPRIGWNRNGDTRLRPLKRQLQSHYSPGAPVFNLWRDGLADQTGLTVTQAIARFGGHAFAGTVIFLIIAIPAIALHGLIYLIARLPDYELVVLGLKLLEYFIFGIAAATFVAYLVVSAYRLIREM
jgi:hypothetical protein